MKSCLLLFSNHYNREFHLNHFVWSYSLKYWSFTWFLPHREAPSLTLCLFFSIYNFFFSLISYSTIFFLMWMYINLPFPYNFLSRRNSWWTRLLRRSVWTASRLPLLQGSDHEWERMDWFEWQHGEEWRLR